MDKAFGFYPNDASSTLARGTNYLGLNMKTVRDGQKVWPYCEECGCRLQVAGNFVGHWYGETKITGLHEITVISDARGCKCSKLIDFWVLDSKGNLC